MKAQASDAAYPPESVPEPPSADFYRSLLDQLHDGVYFVDQERRITYWNRGAERITGFSSEEIVGKCCWDNLLAHVNGHGRELCTSGCPLAATIRSRRDCEADLYLRDRTGKRIPVQIHTAPIIDAQGRVTGAVETFSDNSSKVEAMETASRLRRLAYFDPTTETGNRRFCDVRMGEELNRASNSGSTFGILFADIDHFKKINDRYGHQAGDAVLKTTAGTLAANLRSMDFLGRWGGEEFLIILAGADPEEVRDTAERLRMLIETSRASCAAESIGVTISMGATCFQPGDTAETLMSRADNLLYRSKKDGRNRVTYQFRGENTDGRG